VSIRSIIRKAGTRADIVYLDTESGDGGQLTRTWKTRYANVPVRFNAITGLSAHEQFFYDRFKVFAGFRCYLEHKPGILTTDRLHFGTRKFHIVYITDTDELKRLLTLYLQEITDD
jgi:hypothetical protein